MLVLNGCNQTQPTLGQKRKRDAKSKSWPRRIASLGILLQFFARTRPNLQPDSPLVQATRL